MLWVILLWLLVLVTGGLGFTEVLNMRSVVAQQLFYLFVVLAVVSSVRALLKRTE
jgi:uncharacterized membrane protein YtjA (UPF0391 family)